MSDERINDLYRAFELLLARQEAIEYLVVEFIGARLADMEPDDAKAEADKISSKLTAEWPAIWKREPMLVEDRQQRQRILDDAVGAILERSGRRAWSIATDEDARRAIRLHSPRERKRTIEVVRAAIASGEIALPASPQLDGVSAAGGPAAPGEGAASE